MLAKVAINGGHIATRCAGVAAEEPTAEDLAGACDDGYL
jgi:hypothetical protein